MPREPRFRAVIFDFDGVIADSIPLHFEAFRRVFAGEGVPFTMTDYRRVANGAPRDVVIRAMLGDRPPEAMKVLMARKEEYILALLAERGLEPIPGSLETARAFRDLGLRTGVASSSRTARRFLEALRPRDPSLCPATALFDAIFEADGFRRSKPDPELFLLTAGALGVPPADCLVFEDAVNGVKAGRAAGMHVIALTTTEPRASLGEAHRIVESFAEVDPLAILGTG